jgi:ketol-acid reductoisomerase
MRQKLHLIVIETIKEKTRESVLRQGRDLSLIKGKTWPSSATARKATPTRRNLNDSGVKVVVGLRKGGASWPKVEKPA